jgi:hypothetical protein
MDSEIDGELIERAFRDRLERLETAIREPWLIRVQRQAETINDLRADLRRARRHVRLMAAGTVGAVAFGGFGWWLALGGGLP